MKILFVSLFLPMEKSYHAGGRYVFELLRQLSQHHEIHLATRLQEDEFPSLDVLGPFCRKIHPYTYPEKKQRGLFDQLALVGNYLGFSHFADRLIRSEKYDLVQVEWVETALLIRKGRTPLVLDAHDVITKPAERLALQKTGLAGFAARMSFKMIRSVERHIMGRFATVITMSDFDRNYLLRMIPEQKVRTVSIPAGLDITGRHFEREAHSILFFASYRYRPANVAAALWFYRQVFPLVRKKIPDVRFIIAGYGPPDSLTELAAADPAVRVTGFVDDPEEYYKRAALFVAPILTGGGIIVKVLDALAAGTPVVTTSYGNEGIGAIPGRDLIVADDPGTFAEAVVSIMKDTELAGRLSINSRDFVARHFSLSSAVERLETIYRDAVPGQRDK